MTLASIVPQATANLFLFDRHTKQLELLNVNSQGQPGDPIVIGSILEPIVDPSVPAMTPNATSVAFWSTAANLVSGDTNGVGDVFIRERNRHHDDHDRGHDQDDDKNKDKDR